MCVKDKKKNINFAKSKDVGLQAGRIQVRRILLLVYGRILKDVTFSCKVGGFVW